MLILNTFVNKGNRAYLRPIPVTRGFSGHIEGTIIHMYIIVHIYLFLKVFIAFFLGNLVSLVDKPISFFFRFARGTSLDLVKVLIRVKDPIFCY